MIIFLDLFCGAGGVTTGIERAKSFNKKLAKVIACVNHDPVAIKSHAYNHKKVLHFVEDIRTLDLTQVKNLLEFNRKKYPHAAFAIWASLECTNFSKAKGGKPRDADSRTLAEHLPRYINDLNPEYIFIENVTEFMSWGPLDDNGKPVSKDKGQDFLKWRDGICDIGYRYDHQILNAADFGAYTSRKRYFAQFAKGDLPIEWPTQTHAKKPTGELKKWKAVRDVLDFNDEGVSIFGRKKDLSDKTMQRVYAGLIKYIAGGEKAFFQQANTSERPQSMVTDVNRPSRTLTCKGGNLSLVQPAFIAKAFSANSGRGVNSGASIDQPSPTLNTQGRFHLVQPAFIQKYNSNNAKSGINAGASVEEPCHTLCVQTRMALVQPAFIQKYYSTGGVTSSIDEPSGTLTTKDRMALVRLNWLDKQFSGSDNHQSVDQPAGAIMTTDKHNLVTADNKWLMKTEFNNVGSSLDDPAPTIVASRRAHYLMNPQYGNKGGAVTDPCFTLIARMDKAPPHLISTDNGKVVVKMEESDSETVRKIKEFMMIYGITDIKMRTLRIPELLKIQGFPDNYYLAGTQADQKKFIGNSVVPPLAEVMIKTAAMAHVRHNEVSIAA